MTGVGESARVVRAEVCVVGGGPAGVMLGYLLARAGVDVVVLEKHTDFFRDFRGDTIHPSTLALLGQLGLREEFLELPHSEVGKLDAVVNGTRIHAVDFARLGGEDDFLTFMPQWDFLSFLTRKASEFASFRILMGTAATGVLEEAGRITGVTAEDADGPLEVRAGLTVAADGRGSTVRPAAGFVPTESGVAIDVLWFSLPKPRATLKPTLLYVADGSFVLTIDRRDHFQAGQIIQKGRFDEVKAAGLEAFRRNLAVTAKPLTSVVGTLTDWDQVKLLSVQVSHLERWHRPGLLCIGDSAHAMSPAFGVGVNYAIQDAVATANALVTTLRSGGGTAVSDAQLAAIQRRRLPPVRLMQALQLRVHATIAKPGAGPLLASPPTRLQRIALSLIVPLLQAVAPRLIGRGIRPESVSAELLAVMQPVHSQSTDGVGKMGGSDGARGAD
ncbi:FAD-dependent oxidoreductase [Herbiconiux sp. VKM Ac-2851]|uniref:FAD-dependent oxidoreductase n=1 Tax=Herbiconiux sp. VKM Ac-2851 TaxID=2739025 RepID=UPI0015674736|nr:FAD-dependent oxidoreductase [Herbiconiux sp. VKM Ac-2851]NQX36479.1 FAD-dependent oxidoreductase [Herbiconiux sp. VKM Ac-2851]